ncbi:16S rRNA processing protein [Theileria orientalis strain Shintoku]|uniref:16S rRNA processing protein n=1 Tax=Theileria orientalis strain Shintoku TaxID=869250 RepID=J4C926_THEOR|nr:16S rRNA processing protein [Theileria orientalis strain Shintoku]BAM41803.1 16S rRNA processing protein [Theileria orientalis strain Shintoku]|eukprot:XP_009692104.1 16S rRNA processing protein [Theileria orientalis strain Shintoku]
MEYELNGANALILKKILILFRHISLDLQIIASRNGLNLYALNPSNSVWLHIQLGKGFFEKIQIKPQNTTHYDTSSNIRHWFVSTKHLCQSLSIIIPPGQKNSAFGSVLVRDANTNENLKNSFGLDRLIIREFSNTSDYLSLIFVCSNKNIVRSATISYQEYKLSVPDDLGWSNWHYLRISPSVFYKSINPFSSQYNDLSITYNDAKEDLLLNVINNTSKLSGSKNKKKMVSGKILINSRHFHKLDLDDDLTYPTDITIAMKEFLSLVSFCESIKCPMSLVLRKAGDPVIALFGGSVDACESVTTNLNIHSIVYNGCKEPSVDTSNSPISSEILSLSGSLWISSFKVSANEQKNDTQGEHKDNGLDEEEVLEKVIDEVAPFDSTEDKTQMPERTTRYTDYELDLIYKVLLKDFKTDEKQSLTQFVQPDYPMNNGNSQFKTSYFVNRSRNDKIKYINGMNMSKVNSIEENEDGPYDGKESMASSKVEEEEEEKRNEVDLLVNEPKSKFYIDKSIIYTIPQEDYVVIGEILTTYGLKGHVKVKSYTPRPEVRLCEPGYRYLKIPYNEEKVIPIKLERGRNSGSKDVYIVKFEGFDTVEQSQRLSNTYLTVPLAEMPPLEEDAYYSRDLIGLYLYLYNDIKKTKLGKIVGFVHHSDLALKKKFEEVCDDLIEVQMDMKLSLQTLIEVTNAAKENRENEEQQRHQDEGGKGCKSGYNKGPTIVTERELEDADEIVDMYEEFKTPNFKSIAYVKYYECSTCHREFTNHTQALLHEKEHESKSKNVGGVEKEEVIAERGEREESEIEESEESEKKLKVISIEEIIDKEIKKPQRRFYVPLVRNETVTYIDVENKSVYVDPYTIFIGEDPYYK